jgi:hypothetical protein
VRQPFNVDVRQKKEERGRLTSGKIDHLGMIFNEE